jgi:hypothetical protein
MQTGNAIREHSTSEDHRRNRRYCSAIPGMALAWPLAGLGFLALTAAADAAPMHITDGIFGTGEWTVSSSDGAPARPTVSVSSFNVGGANGAYLYVEQSSSSGVPGSVLEPRLNLNYDFVNSRFLSPSSTFDVFFQVTPEHTDYAVHFGNSSFMAFEKPTGTISLVNPNGTLDLRAPPWELIDPDDLARAGFVAAVGLGPSPNSAGSHLIAEFQLTVDNSGPAALATSAPGLYSPEPAFWSASVGPGNPFQCGFEPDQVCGPISSAIFTLNDDGSTTVMPVLGPDGGPVLQPAPVPEPGTLTLLSVAVAGAWLYRNRRRRATASSIASK